MSASNEQADAPAAEKPRTSETIDTKLVRKLADILKDTDLTEIEVERGELRIRVARGAAVPAAPLLAPVLAPAPTPAQESVQKPADAAAEPKPPKGDVVKSPMVGTVYMSPQPDHAPFIKVGDQVEAGQTLLIVEAMKTMNPIPAPRAGAVLELLVEDAQPVEFGEGLVVIG